VQLEQSFDLPFPRAVAWEAFRNIPMLVSCLPGASLTSSPDANPLAFVFTVKLGPISANFTGQGSVTYHDDCTGSLSGSGADRATHSRVKGDAKFELYDTQGGTRVQLFVDYALTGALAQFGRAGIVKELAAGITRQFAANLREKLEASATSLSPQALASTQVERSARAPLDGGSLLWRVLWARIRRLFGMPSNDELPRR
jgi:carbon monoxide dehydrogenase subunit G